MAQFRKKIEAVEAVQYGLAEYADNPFKFKYVYELEWLEKAMKDKVITPIFKSEDYWYLEIKTKNGVLTVSPDDWVIKNKDGEISVCSPNIFKNEYEKNN